MSEEQTEQESYGTATVGYGTANQKELKIVDFVKAKYKDDRMSSLSVLEDGSYIMAIENYESSGRSNQSMLLSRESLMAVISTATLYLKLVGKDFSEELTESLGGKDEVDFQCSTNLLPKQ